MISTHLELLSSLNERQQEAVTLPSQHALILAGAGSGKTRVLVHRLAWLCAKEHISPARILAVTFTNKAAGEMRHRVEHMLGISAQGLWIGTFHGLANKLLRIHHATLGLPETFQVLDSDDQHRLIRRLLKDMGLDEKYWPAKQVQAFINAKKDQGLRSSQLESYGDSVQSTFIQIYARYEKACQQSGLVDFAELLLLSFELLRNHPEILARYHERFAHILVDEFQDTNPIQYAWLKLLTSPNAYIMAVGDDDQSIYGWRGAKIENIQRFSKEFPHVATIRLEQNYRSTQTILDAANHVIAHNRGRLGKNLWTAGEKGEPISVYAAFNELDEARFIAARIKTLMAEQPLKRSDFALLYRSNAQSRVLEEALIQAALPYRIYGGLRFFERAEIKDVLAYLRLIHNPDDDSAFERIVNTPARGIGDKSLEILRETARTQEVSLWVATNELLKTQALPSRAALALSHFLQLITTIGDQTEELPLHLQIDHIIQHSGLIPHYQKEPGEKGESRVENLQELVTAAREFKPQLSPEEPTSLVAAFLTHAALEAGEGQADEFEDSIQLMTMHAAKGLEFPVVFITGMEDELFPSRFQNDDPSKLEEERRLCYVAMTRAMKKLFFTYAENRRLYGESRPCIPSRFLREVPESCLQPIRLKTQISKPSLFDPSSRLIPPTPLKVKAEPGSPYRVGQRVRHAKFGEGVVINYEGKGELMRLQVNFGPQGIKWLMAAIANLETV